MSGRTYPRRDIRTPKRKYITPSGIIPQRILRRCIIMSKKATIRTRKRGKTYSYSFDAGKNPATGRRKMIEKGGYETAQEAYDAGVAAYADWKSGNIGITSERIQLKDYLAAWLENVSRPNISRLSYEQYAAAIRLRIVPYIGSILLQELRPRDVDAWLHALAAQGLAMRTISNARVVLSHALKYAVYPAELIPANPCTGLTIPRSAPKTVIPRVIITPDILAALLRKYPEKHKYRIIILLAFHTGARISEILGLTWEDADLDAGHLTIARQVIDSRAARGFFFAPPKTRTSVRTISLDAHIISALRVWRSQQSKRALLLGGAYQCVYEMADGRIITEPRIEAPPDGARQRHLICTDKFGLPVRYAAFQQILRVQGLNAHSFRHTHATKLIEAGAKPVDVAARLGHADATITQNLYSHDTEEMQQETAAIFEGVVDKMGL